MTDQPTTSRRPLRWLAVPALALLLLALAGSVLEAASETPPRARVLVVVDASAGPRPALEQRARTAVARAVSDGAEAQLRTARTPTEQLAVTHLFAARGYDAIVGVGLDAPVAVDPVRAHFPHTCFVAASPRTLPQQVQRAAAGRR